MIDTNTGQAFFFGCIVTNMIDITEQTILTCAKAILDNSSNDVLVCSEIQSYSLDTTVVNIGSRLCTVNASVWHAADALYNQIDISTFSTVTGYATGGAVALALAVISAERCSICPTVCSFSAPPVGNRMFAQVAACIRHLRVRLADDVIPTQGWSLNHNCVPILLGESHCTCLDMYRSRFWTEYTSSPKSELMQLYMHRVINNLFDSTHGDCWVAVDI